MKPKLIYNFITEQWRCEGDGIIEYGVTPEQAYRFWRIDRDYKHYIQKETYTHYAKNSDKSSIFL